MKRGLAIGIVALFVGAILIFLGIATWQAPIFMLALFSLILVMVGVVWTLGWALRTLFDKRG